MDSLWLRVSRLGARQTELLFDELSDERLDAKLRATENPCVLFNSLTYVYIYIYIFFLIFVLL